MNRKYELLKDDYIEYNGTTLYRIKALKDFRSVKKGDLGGYIASENNLSHYGNCWIGGNAKAWGEARIEDDVEVTGNAEIYDSTCVYGNIKVGGDVTISGTVSVSGDFFIGGDTSIWSRG